MNKLIFIDQNSFERLIKGQQEIKQKIEKIEKDNSFTEYLTAKEFMSRIKCGRSKFDQLVMNNEIRYVRKGRKIMIPSSEVERYFNPGA